MKNRLYLLSLLIVAVAASSFLVVQSSFNLGTVSLGKAQIVGHDSLSNQVYSSNWAGYVVTPTTGQQGVTAVSGSWTVQTAGATKKATYSAQWIGIGGYSDSTLIQTGSSSDYNNGASYYAWYELLPAGETQITSMKVSPGDEMSASITLVENISASMQEWNLTLRDVSQNEAFSVLINYSSSMASGEWIEERPAFCLTTCRLTTLADFGTAYYGEGYTGVPTTNYATVNGLTSQISALNYNSIAMVSGSTVIAQPSSLTYNGTSFTVTQPSGSSGGGHKK